MNKKLINKLLLSSVLILSLVVATTALADYKPPANPSRPRGSTGSNGTRTNGCFGTAQTTLTALAPTSHSGQTSSSEPVFAWFVPDSEQREMELSLYEYVANGKGKRLQRVQLQSKLGIMSTSFAKEKLSLSVGQKYLWQIALLCNPNRPSQDLVAEAEIQVVAMPSQLMNALSRTTEPLKRAELYAEAGFWYDALGEALKEPQNKAYILKLLEELRKLEAANTNNTAAQQQALQLQQILIFQQK
ncbi:DUF928 domain-containing protein [Scytonema sp. UIC 10036]|uniref:DUF928 domain-containing protein n=1 Tax=Scytonema sp. UIC 10036 TaxID=2304196 RepID=UPI0012DA6F7E|nr:DUF928 domain-containing protein [Scytonema sp. UIC 10036]MUG96615.1 DUF928 domain-containing protein [Scytonema sp. UIC 10036]